MARKRYKGGTFAGAPAGSGENFRKLASSLEGKVRDPRAVAAAIGRKKYGAKRMAQMSAQGRRRRG
jgi:hypothetical protein